MCGVAQRGSDLIKLCASDNASCSCPPASSVLTFVTTGFGSCATKVTLPPLTVLFNEPS